MIVFCILKFEFNHLQPNFGTDTRGTFSKMYGVLNDVRFCRSTVISELCSKIPLPARTSSSAHRTEGLGWALCRHRLQLGRMTAVRSHFGCSRARKLFPDDDIHHRFSGFSGGWKAEIKWRHDALFSKDRTGFLPLLFVQGASIRAT